MKKGVYFVLLSIILWQCAGHKKNREIIELKGTCKAADLQVIPVNTDAVVDVKSSDYIDAENVEIIPLETTDESLLAEITRMIVKNNKIYVFDEKQNAVFVFTDEGRYIGKIDRFGRGPKEYPLVCDFCVDGEWIGMLNFDQLFFYHLDYPDSVRIVDFRTEGASGLGMYSDESHFYLHPSNIRIVNGSVITCDKQGKIKTVLAEPEYAKLVTTLFPPFFMPIGDDLYYHQIYNDTLYQITDTALVAKYVFDCGENRLNYENYQRYVDLQKEIPSHYFYSLQEFTQADSIISFVLNGQGTQYLGLYSIRSGCFKMVDSGVRKDDVLNLKFLWYPYASSKDGYFYSTIGYSFLTWSGKKPAAGSPLSALKDDSNPAVIKYKFKKF